MSSTHTHEMLQLISGFHVARALYVAAKLGVADQLRDGEKSCAEISTATGTDPQALHRLLRVLASVGVFGLTPDQHVSLTPMGETLLTDAPGSLRGWAVDQLGGEHYAAWGELLASVQSGECAFERAFGKNAWAHRAENAQSAQAFDDGMASLMGAHHQAVLAAYPFAEFERLFDIAGGDGQFMVAALLAWPKLRGLVLEQPHVVPRTLQRLAQAGLEARCDVVAGDIFELIPAGGSAYMMSRVIHDWNDDQASQILNVCRRAMSADAVLLLVERVMPEQVDFTPTTRAVTVSDLNMLVMTGGRERTEAEFRALLKANGFAVNKVAATDTVFSVIEARVA